MEHEDNAQFASFLQNTQNNNMNIAGANDGLGLDAGIGCGGVGIGIGVGGQGDIQVVGSVGGSASVGGKYDELDENRHFAADDDNEWKYISEVHQSEKEMQQKVASNGNNNNLHGAYNNDHDDNDDDDVDDDDDDADMPSMQYRKNNDITPNGNGEHLNGAANNHHHHELMDEFDINRADIGDFSTTSNTISTAEGADIGGVQADLLHVEMNFENQHQTHQQQEQHQLHQQQQQHDFEEEDPSSNCTSSLSENLPPQQQLQQLQQQQQQQGAGDQVLEEVNAKNLAFNDGGICDDKENADPFGVEEHGFLLNPDAKEFVPSFSSNPTSPTTSEPDHEHVGEPVEPAQFEQLENKQQQQPQLSAISRHLLLAGDDEFIARSPRKGREMDIDGLAIPPSENEFEHEAAMRPHELEQEEDLIGDSSILIATGANDLPHDVAPVTAFETVENITTTTTITTTTNNPIDNDDEEQQQMKQFNDGADYVMHDVAEMGENLQSPENLIDHDMEIDMMAAQNNHQTVNDVMKQSMYEENYNAHVEQEPEQIENILNSVQQLPTDNEGIDDDDVTTSQDDDEQGAKELLHDHDEKDHVSHPPSIEEMQLNLQNDFSASEKDIAQIPRDLDMNSAAHMQESFYMQQQQQLTEEEHQPEDAVVVNESVLLETSIPFDGNTSLMSPTTTTNAHHEQQAYDYNNDGFAARDPLLINTDFTTATKDMNYDEQQEQHAIDTNASSPSPHSTVEEKHLVEDTKEQMVAKVIDATQEFVDELEQKMENLLSSGLDDGHLKPNDQPFNPKEDNFHEEQQHYENEQQIEEVQEQLIIPNEQKTNEITYEKQITVEATDIEPPAVEVVEKIHEEILETQPIVEPTQPIEIDTDKLAIAAAAVAVTGAVAATGAAATAAKKTEPAVKKTSGVTPKSAVGTSSKAIKKPTGTAPTEASKKPAAKPSTDSARPRTAPSKTTTNTTSTASSARAGSATLAKRTSGVTSASSSTVAKSTGAGLTTTRTVTKTTTTSARLTGATQRTITTSSTTTTTKTAATTAASLGARKSATSPTGVAKSRPSSSQPSKPAVLVAKPKISPRSTLSSQLRNKSAVPTSTTTTTTTTSSSASATNGITKSPLKTSTLTNGVATNKNPLSTRTKPTAASLAKAAPTKTFIARPAPKTNTSSSVPPTTTRRTLLQQASAKPISKTSPVKGSPSASKVAGSPRTTGSSMLRQNGQTKDAKSPITKPKTMTSAKSPIKSENAISKNGNLDNKPIEEKTSDEVAESAKSNINDQSAVGELAQNHDGINALQA